MRKIVVFSLVFALIASAAFAERQGQFSWSGNVIFGAEVDFQAGDTPGQNEDRGPALGFYEDTLANLDFAFTRGGWELGLDFQLRAFDSYYGWRPRNRIRFSAGYFGDNFGVFARTGNLLNTHGGTASVAQSQMDHLWGYFTALGGDLRLDVAYRGMGGSGIWAVSDIVLYEHMLLTGFYGVDAFGECLAKYNPWNRLDEQRTGIQLSYYFGSLGIEGLHAGFMLPFFVPRGPAVEQRFHALDAVRHMVVGAALERDTLGASLMLGFEGEGGSLNGTLLDPNNPNDHTVLFTHVHAGFYFDVTPEITVSGDFAGRFGGGYLAPTNRDGDELFFASFGINATYTLDRLSAGATVRFLDFADVGEFIDDRTCFYFFTGGRALSIEPFVSFALTDTFTLNAGLGVSLLMHHMFMDNEGMEMRFDVNPGISWSVGPNINFDLGLSAAFFTNNNNFSTGANSTDGWDPDIRLTMLSRWSF